MPNQPDERTDWLPVIGRSLAFLCLHYGDMRNKTVVEQGRFLMNLGLARKDAAAVMGSTDDSLRVSLANADKKAPTKKNARASSAARKSI